MKRIVLLLLIVALLYVTKDVVVPLPAMADNVPSFGHGGVLQDVVLGDELKCMTFLLGEEVQVTCR